MRRITLSRTSVVGCLLLQSGPSLTLASVEDVGGAVLSAHTVDVPVARAREALRAAGIDPATLTLTSAQPVTWPDSSLGCPQPGIQYLQRVTSGYRIEFQGAQGSYRVHVAGNQSIVCTGKAAGGTSLKRPLVPLRGIELMTQRAKELLAAATHAPAEQIHVAGFEPQVWPDTGLGCPDSTSPVPGRISGFRIALELSGRQYTFNTDLHRVIACPAIDAE